MNTRRTFLLALSTGAMLPVWVSAQQSATYRIGWISSDFAVGSPFLDPLRAGLREFGYQEGRNLVLEARWGDGAMESLDRIAAELVRLEPHVIVTQGPGAIAMRRAAAAMPIVFGFSGDPVEAGLVESLSRPGRNFTGISFLSLELVGKRMELLKEMLPGLSRVAIVARPEHPGEKSELRVSQAAAKSLGLAIAYFPFTSPQGLDDALAGVLKSRSEAIVAFPDATMMRYSERVAAFSTKNRIPAISGWAQFAEGGNVMTYGPVLRDAFRRLAYFVDRILKGVRPAELPVELPRAVELVVNVKAAKALGIRIPQSVLLRADKVIE